MRSAVRWLVRLFVALAVIFAAMWLFGPREIAARGAAATPVLVADPAILADREAALPDIVAGAEARVIWADAPGERTRWSVLYLHGFSASAEEIRPVPDLVAEALGANLLFNRLPGHGRDGAAMGEATATEWIDDTDLMLDVARSVGDRVLVVSTSTGGTLAAFAATEPDMAADVAGFVFLSPNFGVATRAGRILEWPFAAQLARLLLGEERGFEPLNEAQARYWTERYPTRALVTMGALLREVRSRDLSQANTPALFVFSDADRVVSPVATRRAAEDWGGPAELAPQELPASGVDPSAHVIAGDIVSPAMTGPVAELILEWVGRLQD